MFRITARCPKCYCGNLKLYSSKISLAFRHIPGVTVRYKCPDCGLVFRRKKNRVIFLSVIVVSVIAVLVTPYMIRLARTGKFSKASIKKKLKTEIVNHLKTFTSGDITQLKKDLNGLTDAEKQKIELEGIDKIKNMTSDEINELKHSLDDLNTSEKRQLKEEFNGLSDGDKQDLRELFQKKSE
ncbi:hypothetical protein KAJ27_10150 [bacterium]|nr:hypothetical protein [bacterium]